MKSSTRHRRLHRVLAIVAAIVVAYTFIGITIVPYLKKREAIRYAETTLKRQLRIDKVFFNPFAMFMVVRGFDLLEADGTPLVAFNEMTANFQFDSLLHWAWTLKEIRLLEPYVQVALEPDKRLNLHKLMQDAMPPETDRPEKNQDASGLVRVLLERIEIIDGRLELVDRTLNTPASVTIAPITLEVEDLTTIPDNKGPHLISARLPEGGTLEWVGNVSLNPVASEGQIRLNKLRPTSVWPLLKDRLNTTQPQGMANISAGYSFSYLNNQLVLQIAQIDVDVKEIAIGLAGNQEARLRLDAIRLADGVFEYPERKFIVGNLAIENGHVALAIEPDDHLNWIDMVKKPDPPLQSPQPTAATTGKPWELNLQSLKVKDMAIDFIDRSKATAMMGQVGRLDLSMNGVFEHAGDGLKGRVDDLAIEAFDITTRAEEDEEAVISVAELMVGNGRADLVKNHIELGDVRLAGGQVNLWRRTDGEINILKYAMGKQEEGAIRRAVKDIIEEAEVQQRPWSLLVDRVQLAKTGVKLSDHLLEPGDIYHLENIRGEVKGFATVPDNTFDLNLAMAFQEGGTVSLEGQVMPFKPQAVLTMKTEGIVLEPLEPYLAGLVKLRLASGALNIEGDVTYGAKTPGQLTFAGGAGISDLLLKYVNSQQPFLSWQNLAAKGVQFSLQPNRLKVEGVTLTAPMGEVIIKKDGGLALKDLFIEREADQAKIPDRPNETAVVAEQSRALDEAFPFELKRMQVVDGKMFFADLSLIPEFQANIHDLNGNLSGLSSKVENYATMALEGRVEEYGSTKIEGKVQPFDVRGFTQVNMDFRNIELNYLSPYSAKFAGRKIDSGKISLDLQYEIQKSRLDGNNEVVIDSIILGEKDPNSDAPDLPLDLAVALLSDNEGRMELGLPVSGDIDNPEFEFGSLIWKAFSNMIVKIVSAPFAALASLIGGEDEVLDAVAFDAGRAVLPPPEAEKLSKIATALLHRPQLMLNIQGQYDAAVDGGALKSVAVRSKLAALMDVEVQDPFLLPPLNVTDGETQKALETLAAERLEAERIEKLKVEFGLARAKASKGSSTQKDKSPPPEPDPAGYYQGLFDLLAVAEVVDQATLMQLAQDRAAAIQQQLVAVGEVPNARVSRVEPLAVSESQNTQVASKLTLEAIKKS